MCTYLAQVLHSFNIYQVLSEVQMFELFVSLQGLANSSQAKVSDVIEAQIEGL